MFDTIQQNVKKIELKTILLLPFGKWFVIKFKESKSDNYMLGNQLSEIGN